MRLSLRAIAQVSLLLIVIAASMFVHTRLVNAAETTRLSVSPVTFELSANPGETLTNQLKVTNLSDESIQLQASVENISGTNSQGQVALTQEESTYALSSWVKVDKSIFPLGAKETKLIPFTITVPKNAEPGGHFGSILVGTKAASVDDATGFGFAQKIGSLLLLKVSGQAKEQAAVTELSAFAYDGEWEEKKSSDDKTTYFVPKSDISAAKPQSYIDHGPIAFNLKINNSGNVHVKPSGYITIYNIFHRKVAEIPIEPKNIFPGNDRQLSIVWPEKKLWGIYYSATLAGIYGANNEPLDAQTAFWAFPLWAAITIAVLVIILLVLRRRLSRALRILAKGA